MSDLKPIKIFSHKQGPNPWKVKIILNELNIPYEVEYLDMGLLHTPVYEKYNPNGRCVFHQSSSYPGLFR